MSHHNPHVRSVDVSQRTETSSVLRPAEDGLAIGQVSLAHQHDGAPGIGDGDAPDGEVEGLGLGQNVCGQGRSRGPDKLHGHPDAVGNRLRHLDAEAPVFTGFGFAEGQRPVVAGGADEQLAPLLDPLDSRARDRVLLGSAGGQDNRPAEEERCGGGDEDGGKRQQPGS